MLEISGALNDRSDDNCKLDTQDLQPEMCWEIDRDCVQFDEFQGYEKATEKFTKSPCSFERDSEDSFFDEILYGLVYKLLQNKEKKVNKNIIWQILGEEFFDNLEEKKEILQLDESFCNFEKKCYIANEILTKKIYFYASVSNEIN